MRRGRERTLKLVTGTVFILRERSEVCEVFATSVIAMKRSLYGPKTEVGLRGWAVRCQITWKTLGLQTVCRVIQPVMVSRQPHKVLLTREKDGTGTTNRPGPSLSLYA